MHPHCQGNCINGGCVSIFSQKGLHLLLGVLLILLAIYFWDFSQKLSRTFPCLVMRKGNDCSISGILTSSITLISITLISITLISITLIASPNVDRFDRFQSCLFLQKTKYLHSIFPLSFSPPHPSSHCHFPANNIQQ